LFIKNDAEIQHHTVNVLKDVNAYGTTTDACCTSNTSKPHLYNVQAL